MSLMSLVQSVIVPSKSVTENKVFSFKEKITKNSYLLIKDICKSNSLAAKAIRQEAVKNKGNVRRMLRELKSNSGQKARIAHVVLCFLRGKKYSEVEKNVEDKNKIKAEQLRKFMFFYLNPNYSYSKDSLDQDIKKFLEA